MYYLDKDNRPLSGDQWRQLFQDEKYRTIAVSEDSNYTIITIWIGIAHEGQENPFIFDSTVYKGKMWHSIECLRAPTTEKVLVNHFSLCEKYKVEAGNILTVTKDSKNIVNSRFKRIIE